MLKDVFGKGGMIRILDYLLDFHRPFTQAEVCKNAKVSKPTAVAAFKVFVRDGLIKKIKGRKYEVIWGSTSPMEALMTFDLRACTKENNRIANEEIKKDKKRIAAGQKPIYPVQVYSIK